MLTSSKSSEDIILQAIYSLKYFSNQRNTESTYCKWNQMLKHCGWIILDIANFKRKKKYFLVQSRKHQKGSNSLKSSLNHQKLTNKCTECFKRQNTHLWKITLNVWAVFHQSQFCIINLSIKAGIYLKFHPQSISNYWM